MIYKIGHKHSYPFKYLQSIYNKIINSYTLTAHGSQPITTLHEHDLQFENMFIPLPYPTSKLPSVRNLIKLRKKNAEKRFQCLSVIISSITNVVPTIERF